jgi:DNA-binding transcriptional LysR family regulator
MQTDLNDILPDIIAFIAVARARSFTRAAEVLRTPVSTVSRRVAALETRLGVVLLHRTTRQVAVTAEGSRYFEQVQQIMDALDTLHADVAHESLAPSGPLRISATQDFALAYLLPVITSYSARYPDVQISIDFSSRQVDLLAEGIDVAVRLGPLRDSQLHVRRLGFGHQGIFASPAYLLRNGTPNHPEDLPRHRCMRLQGDVDKPGIWRLVSDGRKETVPVSGGLVANGMRFLVECAAADAGIAILDQVLADDHVQRGALIRILPNWTPEPVPVHALTASRALPGRTRLFLDALYQHLHTLTPTVSR